MDIVRYLLEQRADVAELPTYSSLEITRAAHVRRGGLQSKTKSCDLPIDMTWTEEIRQAIWDESRRRMSPDHGHNSATAPD